MSKRGLVGCLLLASFAVQADEMLRINREVNQRLEYREHPEWSDPREAMRRGWGDCKDYALAKYARALQQGVPEAKLKLAYGRVAGRAHLVLLYAVDDGEPLVLDNLLEPRRLSGRGDFRIDFTFDRTAIQVGARTYPVSRYRAWEDWLARSRDVLAGKARI